MARKRDRRRSDLGALDMRARVAELETTNAHLAAKIAELSFLASAATKLGATLDRRALAHEIIDAVGVATNDRARPRFLLLRMGNALAYAGGASVEAGDAELFVFEHYEALEQCLRIGAPAHAGDFAVVPIPSESQEPGFGCIAVLDDGEAKLGQTVLRRLTRLAELAGRSFANARLLAHSITAGVTDELTGVHNRRYFERRLADEFKRARRLGVRMSLILLDLDRFKEINDRFGHPEGDRTLCAVAKTIGEAVRDIDVVTRWGGEEFAVIIPGADKKLAVVVAERIRAAVAELHLRTEAGDAFGITVSCGVAWAAQSIHTPAQCVAAADRCLLEAKRAGRNRTVAMHDGVDPAPQGRLVELHEITPRDHRGAARDA